MKRLTVLNLMIAITLILGACSTSNDVVSNRLITKRKYTKGFHINKKSSLKSTDEQKDENLAFDEKTPSNVPLESISYTKEEATTISTNTPSNEDLELAFLDPSSYQGEHETAMQGMSDNSARNQDNKKSENTVKKAQSGKQYLHSAKVKQPILKDIDDSKRVDDTVYLILMVICAIILPPLAVGIHRGIVGIFWLDLVLFLIAIGGLFWFPLIGLAGLAAVIIALLVVFDVI